MIPQVRKRLLVLHVLIQLGMTCNTKSLFLTWGIILTRLVTHGNIVSVGILSKEWHERRYHEVLVTSNGNLRHLLVTNTSWYHLSCPTSWLPTSLSPFRYFFARAKKKLTLGGRPPSTRRESMSVTLGGLPPSTYFKCKEDILSV